MKRKPWHVLLVATLAIGSSGAAEPESSPPNDAARRRAAQEIRRGRIALEIGNLDKAEARFRKAMALDEGSPEALVGLGEVRMHRRRFQDALDAFLQAEAGYRSRFDRSDLRSRDIHQGDAGMASELRQRARILQFNIDRLESGLDAQSGGDTGRRQELLRNYRQEVAALEREADRLESRPPPASSADEPVPGELYCAIGNAHLRLSELQDAVEAWLRCASSRPEISWVHNNLAAAHLRLGLPEEARFHMDRATELGFAVHPSLRAEIDAANAQDAPTSEFR